MEILAPGKKAAIAPQPSYEVVELHILVYNEHNMVTPFLCGAIHIVDSRALAFNGPCGGRSRVLVLFAFQAQP